jgi:hypothetical protein
MSGPVIHSYMTNEETWCRKEISREKKFMTLPETPLGRGKGSTSAHLLHLLQLWGTDKSFSCKQTKN